jgi:hypothetical protein
MSSGYILFEIGDLFIFRVQRSRMRFFALAAVNDEIFGLINLGT